MMDCTNGTYVRLDRTNGQDLEGIVGAKSVWRAAAPLDPELGRTTWAFTNCRESG
jgi:hypothetical protein